MYCYRIFISLLLWGGSFSLVFAQNISEVSPSQNAPFNKEKRQKSSEFSGNVPSPENKHHTWAKQRLQQLSLEEKIGQLFMVAAYSNKGDAHEKTLRQLIKQQHIGGLIFMQNDPVKQATLTNTFQEQAKIPLLIAMDAEWGLDMRLDNTFKFPWPLTLGATGDTALAKAMGSEIARHCERLGVQVNFAPVVDLNSNPDNPIINARSLGEKSTAVRRMALAFMAGLQEEQVLACAKHFPGHGNTSEDSHKTLPTVKASLAKLQSTELAPYRYLIPRGLKAVMSAHLNVPALDASGIPASLSEKAIQGYLRNQMGFEGLVFTDALNMKGATETYAPGKLELEALKAGNDVLLFSQDVSKAAAVLKKAARKDPAILQRINESALKILEAKSWTGARNKKYIEPQKLLKDLNPVSSEVVRRQIFEKAITVLINQNQLLPLKKLAGRKIALLSAGNPNPEVKYREALQHYAEIDHYTYNDGQEFKLLNELSAYDVVITAYHTSNASPWKSFKVDAAFKSFAKKLALQTTIVHTLFANPYSLKAFSEAQLAEGLVVAYQSHPDAALAAAQVIFGAVGAKGHLPVTAHDMFPAGFGIETPSLGRLGYGYPEEVGLKRHLLESKIGAIMKEAIDEGATPGAQLLVARKGKVVFQKNYGYHTYQKKRPVQATDIYDLASVTKIAATLPLLMRLVEKNKIDLDKTLGDYLPITKGTNKENLVIRDILAHQARLQPWIPFYLSTMKNGELQDQVYAEERSFDYPYTVAQQLYSARHITDTIFAAILASGLRPKKEYKYSDLGYYLLMKIIENMEGRPLDELATEYLYKPLGAHTMRFHPRRHFNMERIVPTERDMKFRDQLLRGYVHDQGAAMLGGVAGHAGLFASANDMAKMMQMYLQNGSYGGVTFFDSITVREFTRCQFCEEHNRRGIGFDKPQFPGEPGPTCGCVSPLSFGHSGFTGILAWADPVEEIIYVFLSNRVYPDAENRKLISMDIRTKIQQAIYDAIDYSASYADSVAAQ